MSDKEYDILIEIARNTGREVFITDAEFTTLWTNSERTISELLLSAEKRSMHGKPEKETGIPLKDGSVLKITPIRLRDEIRYYQFEVFDPKALFDMVSPSAAFKEYAKQYKELRSSITELAAKTSAAGVDTEGLEIKRLMSSFANKTALFTMLSSDIDQPCTDISAVLDRICTEYGKILSAEDRTAFSFDIENSLYCRIDVSALRFAVSNLMSNAWLYCDADRKELGLKAYRKDGKIYIEISDNGSAAKLDVLNNAREPFSVSKKDGNGEGLGIAIADKFAERFGGELSFLTENGLTVRISLPFCDPGEESSLFSPGAYDLSSGGIARDIFLKGMETAGIRYSEAFDEYIK